MAPIFVVCYTQSCKHANDESLAYSIHPVFRVRKCFNVSKYRIYYNKLMKNS